MIRLFSYLRLAGKPSIFRSFTGLDVSEFNSLYEQVESRYGEFERKRLSRRGRKRRIGAGRPFKLSLVNRLLMLLVYYRLYITSILAIFTNISTRGVRRGGVRVSSCEVSIHIL